MVGTVTKLEGAASVIRNGVEIELSNGDEILIDDNIVTGSEAQVVVTFDDDTQLTLSEDSSLVVDDMVYDPVAQDGSMALEMLTGAATFLSGQIAKANPDAMTIDTPVATIGIRGTMAAIIISPNGQAKVINLPEPDGSVGEIAVSNEFGTQVLNQLFHGASISQGVPISSPEIQNPSDVVRDIGQLIIVKVVDGKVVSVVRVINPTEVQGDIDELEEALEEGLDELEEGLEEIDPLTGEPIGEDPEGFDEIPEGFEEPPEFFGEDPQFFEETFFFEETLFFEETFFFETLTIAELNEIFDVSAFEEEIALYEDDPYINEPFLPEEEVVTSTNTYTLFDYGTYIEVDFNASGTYDGSTTTVDHTVYGDDTVNTIITGGGNDYVYGYGGNDIINVGTGNDNFVDGGIGFDTLQVSGLSTDFITSNSLGYLKLDDTIREPIDPTIIRMTSVEKIDFSDTSWDVTQTQVGYTVVDSNTGQTIYSDSQA